MDNKEAFQRALDDAKLQWAQYHEHLETLYKIQDIASDIKCLLKDLAGGSYSREEMIEMAQQMLTKVGG